LVKLSAEHLPETIRFYFTFPLSVERSQKKLPQSQLKIHIVFLKKPTLYAETPHASISLNLTIPQPK